MKWRKIINGLKLALQFGCCQHDFVLVERTMMMGWKLKRYVCVKCHVCRERRSLMDALYRILAGQTLSPRELRFAGVIVMAWFLMDFVQWVDWLWGKLH